MSDIDISLNKELLKSQLSELGHVLDSFLGTEPRKPVAISEDALDMRKAEDEAMKAAQDVDMMSVSLADLGVMTGRRQESQRIRRDVLLSRRSHRDRILGCLDLASRRMVKLDKESKAAFNGGSK